MFKRFWWIFPVCLVLFPLLGNLAGRIATRAGLTKHESKAVIRFHPDRPTVDFRSSLSLDSVSDQIAFLREDPTIEAVVDDLSLARRWSVNRPQAVRRVRGMVSVQNIPGTELISLSVLHPRADHARAFADSLLKASQIRTQKREKRILTQWHSSIRKQEGWVEHKKDSLREVIRENSEANVSREDLQVETAPISQDSEPPKGQPLDGDREEVQEGATFRQGTQQKKIRKAQAEFEAAQKHLEHLKIHLIGYEMNRMPPSLTIVKQPTSRRAPSAAGFLDHALTGIGILLAILSPFLLIPFLHRLFRAAAE